MEFYLIPPVSYQTQEKLKKKTKRTKEPSSSSSGSNSSSSSLSRDLLASRRGSTSASSLLQTQYSLVQHLQNPENHPVAL